MQMNRVEIAGFLSKRPEIRYLPSGTPVANARLGESHRYQDSSQEWKEHTNWHSLSFYGDLSRIALTFDKGDNIHVDGVIEQREFTPKDGSTRTISEIVVRQCHIIAPARAAAAAGANGPNRISAPLDTADVAREEGPNHDPDWPV